MALYEGAKKILARAYYHYPIIIGDTYSIRRRQCSGTIYLYHILEYGGLKNENR
jgi:hypothetical protein